MISTSPFLLVRGGRKISFFPPEGGGSPWNGRGNAPFFFRVLDVLLRILFSRPTARLLASERWEKKLRLLSLPRRVLPPPQREVLRVCGATFSSFKIRMWEVTIPSYPFFSSSNQAAIEIDPFFFSDLTSGRVASKGYASSFFLSPAFCGPGRFLVECEEARRGIGVSVLFSFFDGAAFFNSGGTAVLDRPLTSPSPYLLKPLVSIDVLFPLFFFLPRRRW